MGCFCDRPIPVPVPEKKPRISSVEEIHLCPGLFIRSSTSAFECHYELLDEHLGKGAYCEVRKCVHRRTGALRAVKIIDKQGLDLETTSSFSLEIAILKRLDHPNILRMFEVYNEDRYYYMVMEYCNGGELFDMIINSKQIYEDQAAGIMEQLFSAVNYLHSKGVVHRDLKPENILVSKPREDGTVHVTIIDFEIAALLDVKQQLTGSFGTVYYMAPEVLDGKYNEKCDLWSLGVIMYILLTGKPPFDGDTERHIAREIKRAEICLEGPEWEYVSPEAQDLIRKLLTPNVKQRISAKDAVQHPWIKAFSRPKAPSQDACTAVIDNLKSFHRQNKLKGAVHTFILTQIMDQRHMAEMQEMFNHLDTDRDGIVTKDDFIRLYQRQNPLADAEVSIQTLLECAELENNGLNYTEFLRLTMNKKEVLNKENLRKAFEMFDEDGNGYITSDEVREWLDDGLNIDASVIDQLMQHMDKDGDGKLDLKDFEDMLDTCREDTPL